MRSILVNEGVEFHELIERRADARHSLRASRWRLRRRSHLSRMRHGRLLSITCCQPRRASSWCSPWQERNRQKTFKGSSIRFE